MFTPFGYQYDLDEETLKRLFPKLQENKNFFFTSYHDTTYNCVSWAIGKKTDWIDIPNYWLFHFNLDPQNLDHSVNGYAECLKRYGFLICSDYSFEDGFEKIAIFGDKDNIFLHAARQLKDGRWTSKIGDFEDITHINLDVISGDTYGFPKIYMKRTVNNFEELSPTKQTS